MHLNFSLIVALRNVRARYVGGHEVGGKLNTGKGKTQRSAQRTHESGLSDSRYAFQKHVASCNDRNDDVIYDVLLSDHIFADFFSDFFDRCAELFHCLQIFHDMILLFLFSCFKNS